MKNLSISDVWAVCENRRMAVSRKIDVGCTDILDEVADLRVALRELTQIIKKYEENVSIGYNSGY